MAIYYAITGGGNWSSAGTWNTASNQATGNAPNAPLVGDTVRLDSYSGQVTIDTTSCVCAVLTCVSGSNYANTLTFTSGQKLSVSGSVTFSSAMTIAGTGDLTLHAAGTLTSNGKTISGSLTYDATGTYVLSGNAVVTGLVTVSATAVCTLNWTTNETLTCNGGLYINTPASTMGSGSAKIIIGGGTLSSVNSGANTNNNIDLAGNVTIGTNFCFGNGAKTLTYVSGTITTTGSTLFLKSNATLNTPTANMSWGNITCTANSTLTLSSEITLTGTLKSNAGATLTLATSNVICAGIDTTSTGIIAGSGRTITMSGGTWQSTGWTTGYVSCNLTLAGNVTISGSVGYRTNTLLYSSGTITTTSSTLNVGASCTINCPTASMHFNNVNCTSTATITLSANITLDGVISSAINSTLTLATSDVSCVGIQTNASGIITGRTITMSGGTWQSTGWTTGYVASNLNIAGNVTISGSVGYATGALTWVSGTVTTTSSSVYILDSCSLYTDDGTPKISFNILSFKKYNGTITLLSKLTATTLYLQLSTLMSGNFDIYCSNFIAPYPSTTIVDNYRLRLVVGTNLNISTSIVIIGNPGIFSAGIITNGDGTASLNYAGLSSNCRITGASFSYIDATGSSIGLDNWYGDTLTACNGITNRTSSDIGGSSSDIFGIIG